MEVSTLFTQINTAYRGSDDDAPAAGTTDYTLWLATINRKISEWASDGKNTWQSLFDIRTIGTISAGTQTYDLDADIILPADNVIVTTTNGHDIEYTICKPQERKRYLNAVYISGHNPQVLTFVDSILSSNQIVGGSLKIAGYYTPEDITSLTDTVPVDDAYWLVYSVASELAFNDLTYESKAADLTAKANNLYAGIVSNNRRGTNNNPRIARTNVNRIPGTRNESMNANTGWSTV